MTIEYIQQFLAKKGICNLSTNEINALKQIEIQGFETYQEKAWAIHNNVFDRPLCPVCNKITKFGNFSNGFAKHCSATCSSSNLQTVNKAKATKLQRYGNENYRNDEQRIITNIERYGGPNPMHSEEVKAKIVQTNNERYGVDNPMQNSVIKQKADQTNLERYGHSNAAQGEVAKAKTKATMIDRYGVESALQNKDIHNKVVQTNIERYGIGFPMQDPKKFEQQQKKCNKYKSLTLPSGQVRLYQGFEDVAILHLLQTYSEDEIISERTYLPVIIYDGTRRYFPDIFIPKDNLIIEVKSTWTYRQHFERNQLKKKAAEQAGYSFQFWICSNSSLKEIIT